MPIFYCGKTTYLNELNPQLQEKFKRLRDMFSDLNVFEAKLNLLHKDNIVQNLSHTGTCKTLSKSFSSSGD
jgi:hypothetical protein